MLELLRIVEALKDNPKRVFADILKRHAAQLDVRNAQQGSKVRRLICFCRLM